MLRIYLASVEQAWTYLHHWYKATPRLQRDYWLSRVLVTSEMDNRGLPASGLESVEQAGPFPLPPLMIPRGGGAEGGIRRCCCCWSCCPPRCPCPCLFPPPSPFPQLTVACCNQMDGLAVILQVLNSRFFYFRHRATRITKNLHLILLRKKRTFLVIYPWLV